MHHLSRLVNAVNEEKSWGLENLNWNSSWLDCTQPLFVELSVGVFTCSHSFLHPHPHLYSPTQPLHPVCLCSNPSSATYWLCELGQSHITVLWSGFLRLRVGLVWVMVWYASIEYFYKRDFFLSVCLAKNIYISKNDKHIWCFIV